MFTKAFYQKGTHCVQVSLKLQKSDGLICTCLTFILWQVSLVDGFFDLVVCPFWIQIHGPAEVHQRQVSLTQLLIHLRDRDRQSDRLVQMSVSGLKGQRSADNCYLSYEEVNQRLFGNDLL